MDFLCLKLGIFLNLLGTIYVPFSLEENLEGAYQTTKKGRKVYMAPFYIPVGLRAVCFLSLSVPC
jgi:hypothetical protein